jgi:hypothetical protein
MILVQADIHCLVIRRKPVQRMKKMVVCAML